MPGDVIQTDFGIRLYNRWVSDIQRFAYVLKPGETEAPPDIQRYWESARNAGFAAFDAMKPGVRGEDVDAAQRALMKENGLPRREQRVAKFVARDIDTLRQGVAAFIGSVKGTEDSWSLLKGHIILNRSVRRSSSRCGVPGAVRTARIHL